MKEDRRSGRRVKSPETGEMMVLAVSGQSTIKGKVFDYSDYGIGIIDYESTQKLHINENIFGIISAHFMDDIHFTGRIVRMDSVESITGVKIILGIQFLNIIPIIDRMIALGINVQLSD
ncbi:hypothetical protein LEP1GSC047_0651 [Leptospira inadai serovar Lyme str. 10]|uniref:Type IV pilus assembly protein PilZ n=2 Tax=Leptospira inadai serovar Lyme TaxID=293084 RepID=V6HBN6_9LEPT|nr:hypothetical protein [Leptospira inadai]EQA37111.1 hypothetical protein LEP1GSC047_0651 [Leptospira inadai serovar Lyme str. 10]PNV76529.1 pilus assembly protein PilZ [Leptospira inadai serovar Lyme]